MTGFAVPLGVFQTLAYFRLWIAFSDENSITRLALHLVLERGKGSSANYIDNPLFSLFLDSCPRPESQNTDEISSELKIKRTELVACFSVSVECA
jgi:hypothetical protein